ncbi:sulfatase-like hydrolase/transferase [Planctomycetota bacterium]|nr:sulfatase-like hydrolase/transferase [Planctomycetota bacterium]
MNPRPNLLLITSDQQHWTTLGILNSKIKTPNLDRLAKMGANFNRAYCPNPTCTPTRASIITGMYPSAHGAYTLGTKLPENIPTLGDHLRKVGYRSTLIGKAHFQPLKSTDESPSLESYPTLRDLNFWSSFNDKHTPWYGFDHCELTRNHGDEGHVGQHYALWLEEQGLHNWREYFQIRSDNVQESSTDASLAPPIKDGPAYGWRSDMTWELPEELHYTTWTGKRTIHAIKEAHSNNQPFFIWSSYHDPHPPYCIPEPWASMYDPDDMEIGSYIENEFDHMPPPHQLTRNDQNDFAPFNQDGWGNHGYHPHIGVTEEHLKKSQAIYYGMISFMDHWIGQTLDTLEELGILDNTLIVFTSDHGHFIGQHGLVAKGPFHYEDVIKVPFIVAWNNHMPAQDHRNDIQSLVDIAPTFLDAVGIKTPLNMQGESQLSSWLKTSEPSRDHAIIENHHQAGEHVHLRTLVTDRYKLTVYRNKPWGELFDLQEDPYETRNRFADPDYAPVRSQMMAEMIQADLNREPAPMPRIAPA